MHIAYFSSSHNLCNSSSSINQAELAVSEFSGNGAGILAAAGTIISTFALVFVAEWGDKSFFSTIGECFVAQYEHFILSINNSFEELCTRKLDLCYPGKNSNYE